jgi:hypothetical protein
VHAFAAFIFIFFSFFFHFFIFLIIHLLIYFLGLFAERNNWRCPVCSKVLRKTQSATHVHCPKCPAVLSGSAELTKHLALTHAAVSCEMCGVRLEPEAMEQHKKESCPKRLVQYVMGRCVLFVVL